MLRIKTLLLVLVAVAASAQQAVELKQQNLADWGIGTANYSGITHIEDNLYAVVSDKEPADGFFLMRIDQNVTTGEVMSVYLEGFNGTTPKRLLADGVSARDCEGICYFPPAGTLFISGEGDQEILEYTRQGQATGRRLNVPATFSLVNIVPNYGFEALAYSPEFHCFWTITESTLPADGPAAGPLAPGAANLLRLQSFGDDLQPAAQYAYRMDPGRYDDFGKNYVFGVPEVCALPDGRLLVLEREAMVSNGYLSSEVVCKLFVVDPRQSHHIDSSISLRDLDPNRFLVKSLIASFTTRLTPFRQTFANYEGMCLGRTLADGRRTLLLISDSQGGAGNKVYHLRDYIKVLILPD